MVKGSLKKERRRALQRLGELFRLVDEAMKKGKTDKARQLLAEVHVALREAREAQADGPPVQPEAADGVDQQESHIRRISAAEVATAKLRAQRQR